MDNNQDYCSYELSKALKAAGFDEPCIAQWACEPDGKPMLVGSTAFVFDNAQLKGRDVTAPLLYHAQKWLREKGIAVSIQANEIKGELWYSADIITTKGINELVDGGFDYMGYEAALSAGIKSCVENLLK